MHAIDNEDAFYDMYALLFRSPFSLQKKNILFSALVSGEPWGWRVVGITQAALAKLAENEFRRPPGLICRAHFVGRLETAKVIFAKQLSREVLFSRLLETDVTVIALKSENRNGGPTEYIPIDTSKGLFLSKLIDFHYRKPERNYLRQLHAQYKSGEVSSLPRPLLRDNGEQEN